MDKPEKREQRVEQVGGGISVHVSGRHTFGTDSFLLSDFAAPRPRERACDLGTGCGIIPLLWFREEPGLREEPGFRKEPGPREAWAVDIQPEAVALVRDSVTASGLEGRLHPLEADLRALGPEPPRGQLDLVTCNPPYNRPGTGLLSEEDSDRIARHETLCTVEDVCGAAERLLRFGGRFCLCQLPERLVDVLAAMRAHRLEPKRLRWVQQRAGDPPWLFLVEGKRGAKPHLRVEPPLIMRERREDGGEGPSREMERIYRYYGKV